MLSVQTWQRAACALIGGSTHRAPRSIQRSKDTESPLGSLTAYDAIAAAGRLTFQTAQVRALTCPLPAGWGPNLQWRHPKRPADGHVAGLRVRSRRLGRRHDAGRTPTPAPMTPAAVAQCASAAQIPVHACSVAACQPTAAHSQPDTQHGDPDAPTQMAGDGLVTAARRCRHRCAGCWALDAVSELFSVSTGHWPAAHRRHSG